MKFILKTYRAISLVLLIQSIVLVHMCKLYKNENNYLGQFNKHTELENIQIAIHEFFHSISYNC